MKTVQALKGLVLELNAFTSHYQPLKVIKHQQIKHNALIRPLKADNALLPFYAIFKD
jgi:hypothetical protein